MAIDNRGLQKEDVMIETYLTDTVTWTKNRSLNDLGTPTSVTSVTLTCRIRYAFRVINDYRGREVTSVGKLTIKAEDKPEYTDTYTIEGVVRKIVYIAERKNFDDNYYEVHIL